MTYDYNEETNTVLIKRESEETPEIIDNAYFVRMMRDGLSGSGSPVGYTLKFEDGFKMPQEISGIFRTCTTAETIELSNVDMTEVEYAGSLCQDATHLKNITLSSMPKIRHLELAFSGTSIDHFDFGFCKDVFKNVQNPMIDVSFDEIFTGCTNLPIENITFPDEIIDSFSSNWIFGVNYLGNNPTGNNPIYINPPDFPSNLYLKDCIEYQICKRAGLTGEESKKVVKYNMITNGFAGPLVSRFNAVKNGIYDWMISKPYESIRVSNKELFNHARNSDDAEFIWNEFAITGTATEDPSPGHNDAVFLDNLINYSNRHNNIPLSEIPEETKEEIKKLAFSFASDSKDKKENKDNLNHLLNALKSRRLTMCFTDFNGLQPESFLSPLKDSCVLTFDNQGYIRDSRKQNHLDERFVRFIKGIHDGNGENILFRDYVDRMEPFKNLLQAETYVPYLYAKFAMHGVIPDNDFLQAYQNLGSSGYKHSTESVKDLWKIYANSKCWSKNTDTATALFNIGAIFGAFEDNANTRQTACNYLRTLTNYIPEQMSLSGYNALMIQPEAETKAIDYNSEITVKPGIPYKPKKAHAAVLDILSHDEDIMSLSFVDHDTDKLDKFLKKMEPLSELMDNSSIESMSDSEGKTFMQCVVKDLYVDTERVDVDVDRRSLNNKESLHKFRKLTEKYAGDEDVNFHVLDSYKAHALFSGLEPVYNLDFAKFIKNHLREILYEDNPWKMGQKLKSLQNSWDYIQTKRGMNRRLFLGRPAYQMSFDEIDAILSTIVYERDNRLSDPKYDEVAELCFSYRYNQRMFERTCDLYDKMLERDHTSIPDISGSEGNYTYKFLSLDDPSAIFFGQILDCCQQYDDAGESCMIHSCESKNGRVFGVFDQDGVMVAGSWTWRNGDTICFDNVEAANSPDKANILNIYKKAAVELREAATTGDRIDKVTVGKGYSDMDLSTLTFDTVNKYPVEQVNYIHDSRTQYILSWNNESHDVPTDSFLYEFEPQEHVNTTLGTAYSSTAGEYSFNQRYDPDSFERPEEEDEDEDYDERHDDEVIDDDIDDCEIIERVEKVVEKLTEREEERE